MKNKKYFFIVIIVLVVGIMFFKNMGKENKVGKKPSTEEDLGISIELFNIEKSKMEESIQYIGSIHPNKFSTLASGISGQILELYVEEGDMVKSGDILARIDDRQLKAGLNTALKKLEPLTTKNNYLEGKINNFNEKNPLVKKIDTLNSTYEYMRNESEKYKTLYEKGAIAKTEYDKIQQETDTIYFQLEELKASIDYEYEDLLNEKNMSEKQVEEIKALIDELNIKIEDCLIKSPIDGVVEKLYHEEGEFASTGQPFVRVDNNNEVLVKIDVIEGDLDKIQFGDKVLLKSNAIEKEIETSVSKIASSTNMETRTGSVEIGPIKQNDEVKLLSGSSVQVSIITNELEDAILIPKSAIKNLNEKNIVYIYDKGFVKEIEISTGLSLGNLVEVRKGLEPGDRLAVSNLSKLYDSAKVYVFKGEEK